MNRPRSFHLRLLAAASLLLAIALALPAPRAEAKAAKLLDLADAVSANPILTKMSLVIQGSDLGTFLSSRGPFTLFAPTNAAFAKLPPGTLEALLQPQNKERLQRILLFHVVSGKKLGAKDLLPLTSLLSCEGDPLPLKTTKAGVQLVLKAKIVRADIKCQNGIINEIDTVLMPPEKSLPPLAPLPPPPPPTPVVAPVVPSMETNAAPSFKPDLPTGATPPASTNAAPVVSPEPPAETNAAPSATPEPPASTNAAPVETPAPTADTNAAPVIPATPEAAPELSPH